MWFLLRVLVGCHICRLIWALLAANGGDTCGQGDQKKDEQAYADFWHTWASGWRRMTRPRVRVVCVCPATNPAVRPEGRATSTRTTYNDSHQSNRYVRR